MQSNTTLPATVCGQVQVTFTDQQQHARVFSNGAFAGEGMLFVSLSANGKTLDANVSGPGRITPNADGSVLSLRVEGRNLIFFNAGKLGPGQPGALYLSSGLVTERITFASSGGVQFSDFTTTGTLTNVCTILA